ncbi:MAG: hypothetical protein IJI73_11760 [Kiritimatiellae bacterium]|nr:hypothetical protein [Kiritimatiellia bacterium]
MKYRTAALARAALALGGCASYRWTPGVPAEMRTVSVPVFRNESGVTGLGARVSAQVLREFQREGTFEVRDAGDSAIEVQGVVKSDDAGVVGYERRTGQRNIERRLRVTALVSVIDKRAGRVLVNDRKYVAKTTFASAGDQLTAERDASGRIAEEFAREIVDDLLDMDFGGADNTGGAR